MPSFNVLDNLEIINSITWIVVGTNLILTAIVVSRGWRNAFNLLFGAVSLSLALWGTAIVGFYSKEILIDINWILWTHTFALLVSVFFLYFSILYPSRIGSNKHYLIYPIIPVIAVLYFIFAGDSIIGGTDGITYEINGGYIFYSLLLLFYFFSTYTILILQYRRATDANIKIQLKYIFIGYTAGSLLATFTNLTLPFFNIFEYTWTGPLFTLFLVVSIFLSMVRHGLFNIRIIIAEIFSILIILGLLFDIFVSDSTLEVLGKTFILIIISVFLYRFIKGVYREVKQKELLALANKQLERLNLEKSEFLSLASHQLKAPLSVIKGYSSMLTEGSFGQLSEKGNEVSKRIFDSANNLVIIIDDFLNVSRIDQGRMKYDFGSVDIKEMISTIVTDLSQRAQETGVDLSFETDNSRDYIITADVGKIRQVVTNIVDNSLKYKAKERHGYTKVKLSKDIKNKRLRIDITDDGLGLSEQNAAKIFKRFSRAKDVGKSGQSGSGLGLYIVRQMVEGHDGRVWVNSEGEGKGSTFSIELPFTQKEGESEKSYRTEE